MAREGLFRSSVLLEPRQARICDQEAVFSVALLRERLPPDDTGTTQ